MKKSQKILITLTLMLIVLNFLDFFLTLLGVARFGLVVEGNPVVKKYLEEGKAMTWFCLKAFASIMILGVIIFSIKFDWGGEETKKVVIFIDYLIVCFLFLIFLYINGSWIIDLLRYY